MGVDARMANVELRTLPVVVIKSPVTEIPQVEGSVDGLKCDMLVDTGTAVTLAIVQFIQGSIVLWNVPIPTIRLKAVSGTELIVASVCIMEIVLGDLKGSFPSDPVGVVFHAVPQLHPIALHVSYAWCLHGFGGLLKRHARHICVRRPPSNGKCYQESV
ncbi:hypothetical protein T10_147 [Trichinella papuae]|uniref:Uncharacterized protein n=1 Tax=Trichinella papuae TaxID=268474 RepID=A0A0V1N963_9BILA|nr:hypothetical protein T10_147 [Trichinella papuae]